MTEWASADLLARLPALLRRWLFFCKTTVGAIASGASGTAAAFFLPDDCHNRSGKHQRNNSSGDDISPGHFKFSP